MNVSVVLLFEQLLFEHLTHIHAEMGREQGDG